MCRHASLEGYWLLPRNSTWTDAPRREKQVRRHFATPSYELLAPPPNGSYWDVASLLSSRLVSFPLICFDTLRLLSIITRRGRLSNRGRGWDTRVSSSSSPFVCQRREFRREFQLMERRGQPWESGYQLRVISILPLRLGISRLIITIRFRCVHSCE